MKLKRTALTIIIVFLLVAHVIHACKQLDVAPLENYLKKTLRNNFEGTLNHLTVSENGNDIYLGTVGRLYHLSTDFNVLANVSTGENNTNKILSIAPHPVNRLISCGSGLNGTCQLRFLDNLTDTGDQTLSSLRITEDGNTTIGLVVPHPATYPVRLALYVAKSIGKNGADSPIQARCLSKSEGRSCQENDNRQTNHMASGVSENFLINYAASFSYNGYVYFLASQLLDATSKAPYNQIVPKLSRVCQTDSSQSMDGFTEIILECRGRSNTVYSIVQSAVLVNDQLFGIFAKNYDGIFANQTDQSALCVYDMENLTQEFNTSTISCTCGDDICSSNNYLQGASCRHVEKISCDDLNSLNLPCEVSSGTQVFASYPERSAALGYLPGKVSFECSGEIFTSVFFDETDVHKTGQKVAIIGTQRGHLLKVRLDPFSNGVLFEKLDLSYPVLSDTRIAKNRDSIMVLTTQTLFELSIANCSQFSSCDQCIKPGTQEGDPYCGWCVLEKRCTLFQDCNFPADKESWLPFDATSCVNIEANPAFLPLNFVGVANITITVSHLPDNDTYSCHFGEFVTSAKSANMEENVLFCLTPEMTTWPDISANEDAVEVQLSLSSSEKGIKFVSTPYYFFDCSKIMGCRNCLTKYNCTWCLDSFSCSNTKEVNCLSSTSQAAHCPIVMPGDRYIPNDVNRDVILTVQAVKESAIFQNKEYECIFTYKNRTTKMAATVYPSMSNTFTVRCNDFKYFYEVEQHIVHASMGLRMKTRQVDVDGIVNVMMYKCDIDRPDCSRCLSNLTTMKALNCIWCPSTSPSCTVQETCEDTQRQCTDIPQVTTVNPPSGPFEGGTIVQINGTDLGQRFSDIDIVQIGAVVCNHENYNEKYRIGQSVSCLTRPSNVSKGTVSVTVKQRKSQGTVFYSYADPQITSAKPLEGPSAGGTLINIGGSNMNSGGRIEVILGNQSCRITNRNSTNIKCKTMKHISNTSHSLVVMFDGHPRDSPYRFTYKPNPRVHSVKPCRAIMSGGNLLTVQGERLNIIQKPRFITYVDDKGVTGPCEDIIEDRMICRAPNASGSANATSVDIGFVMDDVKALRNWRGDDSCNFHYVRDPVYQPFKHNIEEYNHALLTIKGEYLDLGSQVDDIKVYVGTEMCTDVTLTTETVHCIPPSKSPAAGDLYGRRIQQNLPFVIVRHANLEIPIGYLRYGNELIPTWLIMIAIPVLIVILVAALVMTRIIKLNRSQDAEAASLKRQITQMETRYEMEMKTLFTNLRTTRHDLQKILQSLPTNTLREPSEYVKMLLFGGLKIQPYEPEAPLLPISDTIRKSAMEKFGQLLRRSSFLNVLVETMDFCGIYSQQRANIASHLTMCLVLDGRYFIVTKLVESLIEISIRRLKSEKTSNFEELFGRGDTFHEMLLSDWLSLSLYDYMQKLGKSLQELSYAAKIAIEMGPVDAVTGKSQFSINEKTLLESQIDFDEMTLQVLFKSRSEKMVALRFLSVDTITQVKSKILDHFYLNQVYSSRPLQETFYLVWYPKHREKVVLNDDDCSHDDVGWEKLKTLTDYKIHHGDCIELIQKEHCKQLGTEYDDTICSDPSCDYEYVSLLQATKRPNTKVTAKEQETNDKEYMIPDVALDKEGYMLPKKDDDEYHNINETEDDISMDDSEYEDLRLQKWHLSKDVMSPASRAAEGIEFGNEIQQEPINEILLPYLAATKNAIHRNMEKLFDEFMVTKGNEVPLAIKCIFDFFDAQAIQLNNPSLAQTWKDNLLPMGLWAFLLNNCTLIYDIHDCSYAKASLETLAHFLHDMCLRGTTPEEPLGLGMNLYSCMLPAYGTKLDMFYNLVKKMKAPNQKDLIAENNRIAKTFRNTFDLLSTRYQLYGMVSQHRFEICDELRRIESKDGEELAAQFSAIQFML